MNILKLNRRIAFGIFVGTMMFGMTLYADTLGKVNDDDVVLKQNPQVEANDVRELDKEEVLRFGNSIDDYLEVMHDDTVIGYVESKYIDINKSEPEPVQETQPEPVETSNDKGEEIVKFALKHVGNPYVYGGTSLTRGTDCSGFTSSVYKNFGINIQRSSRSQYASTGRPVKKSELKPGDLVFYGYNGNVSHVALYMGNNKIVHASTPKTGICIAPLEQRGGTPYIGAKRVI